MSPRLLVVDHHATLPAGRALYDGLAATGRFTVRIMAPERWTENGVTSVFDANVADGGTLAQRPAGSAASIVASPVIFGGRTHRNLYCGLFDEVRSFRPDILLVNSEPEGFLAMQAALVRETVSRKPALVFTTWRNMPYGRGGEPFPVRWSWLCSLIERIVLPRAAWGIGLSPSAPGIFREQAFTRISYVPPWVDLRRFDGVGRAPSSALAIGYVGRLVHEKGVDILLRSLARVAWPYTLTVTGNGPELPGLRALANDLGIAERCTFSPSVSMAEIPAVMRSLDLLILPSRSRVGWREQFGRVLIEAMAAGTAVAGSDNGDIPSVIGEAGRIFPENDVSALHRILEEVNGDRDLLIRLRNAGRARVEAEFSLERAVARHVVLLEDLLASRGGAERDRRG
jgi:glycosyltransferase involved in cell wall biosynthesis